MKRYYVVCIGIGAVLAGITLSYRNEPTKFYGIADTKETIVNAEDGVAIKKLCVVQGQAVKAGDTIVILDQPELAIRINQIENTLEEYRKLLRYQTKTNEADRRQYQAEQKEKINEIKTQISELEAQYARNIKLVNDLTSLQKEKRMIAEIEDGTNTLLEQINGLKRQLEAAEYTLNVDINRQKLLKNTDDDPTQAQIRRYTRELELLQQQRQQLVKTAPIGGMIGMVKFKEGEKISPFDTILTLHAAAPSYIKGYIHENVYSQVAVGDTVEVKSFADMKQGISGIVVGVGSRIVDYPERLRKRQDIPVWGREVLIKIPEDNSFLLGEKVLISVVDKKKRSGFLR
ncbi:MAG: biotin/lipoyl-binding protein [Chitinispirillaceae bacterium]|nr:biotin/lipoyl-binding protein [Chitinispirillaceae bacterium]